jgi:hypothetical protein
LQLVQCQILMCCMHHCILAVCSSAQRLIPVRDQHSLSSSRVWNVNYQKATVVVTAIAVAVTVRAAVAVVAEVTVVAAVVVLCIIGVTQPEVYSVYGHRIWLLHTLYDSVYAIIR